MMSKCIGSVRWKKNGSELKFHFFHGKMEYKQVFKYVEEHIRFVYQALFYLSYVIHAPTLKNDTRLAPLLKSGRIPCCLCFRKYIKYMFYKSWTPRRRGAYISYGESLFLAA